MFVCSELLESGYTWIMEIPEARGGWGGLAKCIILRGGTAYTFVAVWTRTLGPFYSVHTV